jgi:SNF2 family DNA or RNA helicase
MSQNEMIDADVIEGDAIQVEGDVFSLTQFIAEFGDGLMDAVREQNPPIYDGQCDPRREAVMESLLRKPFPPQRDVVQAISKLLVDENQAAAVINAEMGTGKTMMAIAVAAVMHAEGYQRTLVISPPHLVYKWRREIRETVPGARVWVLNGPDTLKKLLQLRTMRVAPTTPEFFVMGRVRMRLGFNWRPVFITRRFIIQDEMMGRLKVEYAACPSCGTVVGNEDGNALTPGRAHAFLDETRRNCTHCKQPLWTLVHKGVGGNKPRRDLVLESMRKIPTIGDKTAGRLLETFGEEMLGGMLEDNVFEFINLMDEEGDLFFSDRQAKRMERAMSSMEFSFGQGGYQATEFIKRYLPQGYFGLLVVDEGHEYKNEGSAQGQAMGVLARKCSKTLLLTGTLMGGYADDLFYLLWRLNPRAMIEDGFRYNARGSLGAAAMSFMREHGVLKDIYKESESTSHRTARGKSITHRTSKGPGFGPKGVMRHVLPYTAFLKLKEIGGSVLPPYLEHFDEVAMTDEQSSAYRHLYSTLKQELSMALRCGDKTLMGVVLNVLLAWPDCAFRDELVRHPRSKSQLVYQPAVFSDADVTPKEAKLLEICKAERARGRRVLAYTVYTGTRDTTARLKSLLDQHGFKTAVLRASVDASKREDWLFDQVDRGVDVIITNPELVKTGLDMLEFPTIVFMQSGYNVYTLQQAARRSWRIGQKLPVDVYFLGYGGSAQIQCLELMAKKIAVSQSTSGDMPDSGLDVLNQGGDSIEVALAKQLVK